MNIGDLNARFPEAGFSDRAFMAPGLQKIRMSTGAEVQVVLPKLNVPLRFYWAYNLLANESSCCYSPIVFDPSAFPNGATLANAINTIEGGDIRPGERRSMFRFAIGRTF